MSLNVPNALSVLRVLAAPCVAFSYALLERPEADKLAVAIFVGAALTDYLDGILARWLGQESPFGRMLDPIADKAMVLIALAVLMALHDLEWPVVIPGAVIIMREVLVSGLREYLGDVKLPVTRLAKWKTTLQMFAIGFLLGAGALRDGAGTDAALTLNSPRDLLTVILAAAGLLLLWIAAWFTLVTGGDYFLRGLAYIREQGRTEAAAPRRDPVARSEQGPEREVEAEAEPE